MLAVVRDASLWFVYENTLLVLYFLGYIIEFNSLIDNEVPVNVRNIVFIPGGYPELQRYIYNFISRFGVLIRWVGINIYFECGVILY